MDEEYASYLPVYGADGLDSVPIVSQLHQIRQVVVERIDASIKYDQLKAPQVYNVLIKPIVEKINLIGLNGGTLYSLLANIDQFQKEGREEPSNEGLCKTRASTCEIICTKLIKEYTPMQLAEALIFDFYPLSDGADSMQNIQVPSWLRISAIELAIHTQSKHFLSHPSVVELVQDLWNGRLVFDTYLNKSHRFNFNSREEMGLLVQSRKGIVHRYHFKNAGLFRLSRLRVPRYRAIARTLSMLGFMFFYFMYGGNRENHFYERAFLLYGVGLCLDEALYFWTVRPSIYLMSLWNICDLVTLSLFILQACIYSYYPNTSEDLLATMSITLVPRIFGVFDANESFSKMLIAVRQMSIDLGVSWIVVTVFSIGFWAAFALNFSRSFYSPQVVAYEFVRILFGYTGAGWDQWHYYRFFGKASLLAYLFLTQFVVRPILTAVLSDTYSHVNENSTLEYNYLRSLNTISKLKTEATVLFFFVPPLNILEWLLYPTQYLLPYHRFLILNRTILKITHFPLLFSIFIYESVYWRLSSIKQAKQQNTRENIARKVASLGSLRSSHDTLPPLNVLRSTRREIHATNGTRARAFSNYALLDELFNNPVLSVKYGQSIPGNLDVPDETMESAISGIDDDNDETNGNDNRSDQSDEINEGTVIRRRRNDTGNDIELRLKRLEDATERIESLLVSIKQEITDKRRQSTTSRYRY